MLTVIAVEWGEHLYASTADAQGWPKCSESMDDLARIQWTICPGITGRFGLESMDDLRRNTQRSRKSVIPIRSDYDYGKGEGSEGTPLFKLHGCISQDLIDGSKARIVLTERDYEEYRQYREILYRRLAHDLLTKDVLVIGQSLRDPHLRREMSDAARYYEHTEGIQGRLFMLAHEGDPDRARLWEDRNFSVTAVGIDQFLDALTSIQVIVPAPFEAGNGFQIPPAVRASTIEVTHARSLRSNPARLFNGGAATYADIAQGMTFRRSIEQQLVNILNQGNKQFLTITGVAGVGKTSLRDVSSACWPMDMVSSAGNTPRIFHFGLVNGSALSASFAKTTLEVSYSLMNALII